MKGGGVAIGKRGSSKKKFGVADYFAVLAIESFLPPNHYDGGDDTTNLNPSLQHNDVDNNGLIGKTPRNDNLSSSRQNLPANKTNDTATGAEQQNENNKNDNSNQEADNLHRERFEREIVQLDLLLSSSSTLPLNLDSDDWELSCGKSLDINILNQADNNSNNHHYQLLDHFNKGKSIQLVYRRRRKGNSHNSTTNNNDDDDDYYKPAIADISIQYTKIKRSTIPNSQSIFPNSTTHQQFNINTTSLQQQDIPMQSTSTTTNNAQTSSSSPITKSQMAFAAAAQSAKTLSSLAKRSGIAAAGKGLANKVIASRGGNVAGGAAAAAGGTDNDTGGIDGNNNNHSSGISIGGSGIGVSMGGFVGSMIMRKSQPQQQSQSHQEVQSHGDMKGNSNTVHHGEGGNDPESLSFQQPNHLYDTGKEGSFETDVDDATNFTDVDGNVPLWRSSSGIADDSPAVRSGGNNTTTTNNRRRIRREHFFPDSPEKDVMMDGETGCSNVTDANGMIHKSLKEMLPLPDGFDEWVVPDFVRVLHLPTPELVQHRRQQQQQQMQRQSDPSSTSSRRLPILVDRTRAIPSPIGREKSSPSSMGVEAMYRSPSPSPHCFAESSGANDTTALAGDSNSSQVQIMSSSGAITSSGPDPAYLPSVIPLKSIPSIINHNQHTSNDDGHVYIPILAVRRQRVGEDERFNEDAGVVDVKLSYFDSNGVVPEEDKKDGNEDDDDDDFDDFGESTTMMHHQVHKNILKMSEWGVSLSYLNDVPEQPLNRGLPQILLRRNRPNGFADLPFQARVLDRFPSKDYRGMPFPEEELPLFCYPGGSYLVRKKLKDLPLPKCFGFVVKNERGDSIYVSCLSFLEPLTMIRKGELDLYSKCRQGTSLPHRVYCQQKKERSHYDFDNCLLAFDDVVTYECKTICLVGRYPYWTEFRRFLSHLHLLSGSSCDIPLERHISHLLLSVPVPKHGGQCVLVPLSTMNEPMALVLPPLKDLPLVDLSYQRLFSALDVPTVVTVVLGFLCLEKKVILISTRQSLVLDCCELLKSLVFPFELVAPYGPLLTEAFMSLLEFPGATFVGIHDDGKEEGLAKLVRNSIPEDSVILDLDNGEISCDDRYETLKAAYQIIPAEPRSMLIKEIEALCADAGIVPGQEPLDYGVDDSAIDVTCPRSPVESSSKDQRNRLPFDDRAVRDNFLRFFCSILGGYERFLVVPDADFLISGNDWFDSSKFIATATPDRVPFLSSFVNTQMFQSFIQRRTEASDVHCMLFDECIAEFHSSTIPYGRLGGDVAHVLGDDGKKHLVYNLLVDECATEPDVLVDDDDPPSPGRSGLHSNKSFDDTATQTTSRSYEESITSEPGSDSVFAVNQSGDIVTIPSAAHLNPNAGYVYCLDGSPSFPTKFDRELFLPKEPNVLAADTSEVAPSSLIRSEREREDANRLFNMTVSKRGPRETQKRHRCLWQLAKYMGSQFLGAWLMCIPAQISQLNLPTEEKSRVLLRALGALRLLRSHRRIVADEAAYRALIVACGKCGTDRRVELMKLYGLMRNDGIFPDAVTLGQYTRAIAEGYSNRSADANVEPDKSGTDVASSPTATTLESNSFDLDLLDTNLSLLEESGMRWKSRGGGGDKASSLAATSSISQSKTFETGATQRTSKSKRQWHPVYCSSSFFPMKSDNGTYSVKKDKNIRLVALWSRTTCCKSCSYIPLDEEIQSGWDVARPYDNADAMDWSVPCPRCNALIVPLIGYKVMGTEDFTDKQENQGVLGYKNDLPPQLESKITNGSAPPTSDGGGGEEEHGQSSGFVSYLSPKKLRLLLEQLVVEFGEEILDRDRLREVNPQALFNLWWYCARFSLPLPLAISPPNEDDTNITLQEISDACAFASWDKSIAMQGCRSAAKAIGATRTSPMAPEHREKLFDNPSTDSPLLAFFNLQGYCQADWDHADLSEVLVSLVKACDTTDLTQAVACICQKNEAKEGKEHPDGVVVQAPTLGHNMTDTSFGSTTTAAYESFSMTNPATGEPSSLHKISPTRLDCYRTLLYLARYQCTTAFHAFFPTTTRACKGYHFWCAQGTPRPIFDRAFREAADDYNHNRGNSNNDDADGNDNKAISPAIHGVSEVGVGFRCIFGHMI
eukprot:scaffold8428_cov151-Skeletonema_menzelii.AAC.1